MMIFVGISGMIIGMIGIILFFSYTKEIKLLCEQLKYINERTTNKRISTSSRQGKFIELVAEINKVIDSKKNMENDYEKMDRELREAITNISHDLRTPLTSMRGYLQLIEKQDVDEEKKKVYLNTIASRSKALQDLVENFYILSCVNSSSYTLEYERINIGELFCQQLASFYQDFTQRNIEPKIEIQEGIPSIVGDEKALNRIFMNLIQNALRYAKRVFEVNIKETNGYLVIECANETSELKPEEAMLIFDRCFTGNKERSQESTGIGLAVVKQLVEKMNGEVEAEVKDERLHIRLKWKS